MAMLTRYGTVTVSPAGQDLRVGTSRFLSQGLFLVYKSSMAAFFLFWGLWWPEFDDEPEFGAKLTFWTWYTATAYFLLSTASAYLRWRAIGKSTSAALQEGENPASLTNVQDTSAETVMEQTNKGARMPVPRWLEKLQLVVWNVACLGSLIVVTVFWSADYDGTAITSLDILAHGLIALFMLVDQVLIADVYKLQHVVFSQAYGVLYIAFNVFWFYTAPENEKLLYRIMDWKKSALVACAYGFVCILILAPLFSLLHLHVYRCRERLYEQRQNRQNAKRARYLAVWQDGTGQNSA